MTIVAVRPVVTAVVRTVKEHRKVGLTIFVDGDASWQEAMLVSKSVTAEFVDPGNGNGASRPKDAGSATIEEQFHSAPASWLDRDAISCALTFLCPSCAIEAPIAAGVVRQPHVIQRTEQLIATGVFDRETNRDGVGHNSVDLFSWVTKGVEPD
jgi:hypothetical protein